MNSDYRRPVCVTPCRSVLQSVRYQWLLSVGGGPIDPRDLTSHCAQVGAELAAMVDRMLGGHRKKIDSGRLNYAEQVDDVYEFLA